MRPPTRPPETPRASPGSTPPEVRARDLAGKLGTASISVTVDNALPSVSFFQPPANKHVRQTEVVKVSASDAVGLDRVELRIDSGAYVDITANFDGSYYTYSWNTATVPSGAHTLTTRATDLARLRGLLAPAVPAAEHDGRPRL